MCFKKQALKQSWHARLESARTAIRDGNVQEKQDFFFFYGFVHLLATTYSPAWCVGWIFFFFNETFARCIWQTICRLQILVPSLITSGTLGNSLNFPQPKFFLVAIIGGNNSVSLPRLLWEIKLDNPRKALGVVAGKSEVLYKC